MPSICGELTVPISWPALTVAPVTTLIVWTCTIWGRETSVAGSRYGARSAKEHERRTEIDDKERQHAEHRGAIGKADQSSRGAPPALYRIGYVRIEAVDRDVHGIPFRRDLPTGRAGRGAAQSRHAARWRRGFQTNTRRSAHI